MKSERDVLKKKQKMLLSSQLDDDPMFCGAKAVKNESYGARRSCAREGSDAKAQWTRAMPSE